jgi:ParB family chromosome partitioning protein
MDYSYLTQPAMDPNYHNQIGQNISGPGLLNDDQDKELMLDNMQKQEALDSGIDLSKMINFGSVTAVIPETNNIDNNFKVVQTVNTVVDEMPYEQNIDVEKIVNVNSYNMEEKKEDSFFDQSDSDRIYQIEVNKIVPNPYQPRREFSDEAIQELASSIREYGVLEPLIVKRIEKEQPDGINIEYQLIAGERRLRASKVAGLKTVPALIKSFDNKCLELEVALVENVQREDLSPIMKARAYGQLVNEFGYTQEMVGRRVGKSREAVANALRLLQLPFEAQKALDENKITESHARALLLLPNMEKQRALLGEVLSKQLSSREAEMIARQFIEKQNIKTGNPGRKRLGDSFSPKDLELREKLESLFDAKVMIKRKGDKGEISIFFYSEDEFNGLVDRITHNSEKNINQTVDKLNNI